MPQIDYDSPPITEAVIEIRFSRPHAKTKLKSAIKSFSRIYSNYSPQENYNVEVGVHKSGPAINATTQITHRFSSSDMTEQLTLKQSNFLFSQLAPYQGWEHFIRRFSRDFKEWVKIIGYKQIIQIGVRYINRLDIPETSKPLIPKRFLNIYPTLPRVLGNAKSHAVQAIFSLDEIESLLNINSAIVNSPLARHISLIVDQDIIRKENPPQNAEGIISFLNEVRVKKNEIFESCVTENSRKLFFK